MDTTAAYELTLFMECAASETTCSAVSTTCPTAGPTSSTEHAPTAGATWRSTTTTRELDNSRQTAYTTSNRPDGGQEKGEIK